MPRASKPVVPARIGSLLGVIDRAYDHRSWHGTNLRGAIRGLPAAVAARRPAPGAHNIWELVVHAAYWKYAVWRRLTGGRRGSFDLDGSNWFTRPDASGADERTWRADVALLQATHAKLRRAIEDLGDADLTRVPTGATVSVFDLVSGSAAHDLYHAGQIQLIKRLVSAGKAARARRVPAP